MNMGETFGELGKELQDMHNRLDLLERWKQDVGSSPELPNVLTAEDVSTFLQISKTQGYALMKSMPSFGEGKWRRVRKQAFFEWIRDHEKKGIKI